MRGLKVAATGSQKRKSAPPCWGIASGGRAGGGARMRDSGAGGVRRLALAIIDEQHRFGVAQRLALRGKLTATSDTVQPAASLEPHLLMMTATPIPRTLAARLRRPGCVHHRRTATGAHAHRDPCGVGRAAR